MKLSITAPSFTKKIKQPFTYHGPGLMPEDDPVDDPRTVLDRYEPVDVLNGALLFESIDKKTFIFEIEDSKVLEQNEYPNDLSEIYFQEI